MKIDIPFEINDIVYIIENEKYLEKRESGFLLTMNLAVMKMDLLIKDITKNFIIQEKL